MDREVPHNFDETVKPEAAPGGPEDELLDIDPADFVDPEEFIATRR